jgi:hypothetical protein
LQDPTKFTQIGIFGLKMYHLATLFQKRVCFPDISQDVVIKAQMNFNSLQGDQIGRIFAVLNPH